MVEKPRDITGREIKVGDVLAIGQRAHDTAELHIRVVSGFKLSKNNWGEEFYKIQTTSGGLFSISEKTIIVPSKWFVGTQYEELTKDAN